MRRVAQIMGMPITIDIPDSRSATDFETVFELLREIDNQFSPYKKSSELSKFIRGELAEKDLSSTMNEVIKACIESEKETEGYFSAWYGTPPASHLGAVQGSSEERVNRTDGTKSERQSATDATMRQEPADPACSAGRQGKAVRSWGKFDPSGYVKGWAIAGAGDILKKLNYKSFCIAAGGDILASSDGKKVWKIGIQDPAHPRQILNVLSIKNGAVATSGNYERGEHIINPKTGKPANELLSFTVTGPDIIKADILATAGFAMGKKGADFVNSQPGYSAYAYPGK